MKRLFCYGLGLWIIVTALIWQLGELITSHSPLLWLPFILLLPIVYLIIYFVSHDTKVMEEVTLGQAAALLAMPGFVIDMFSSEYFPQVIVGWGAADFTWAMRLRLEVYGFVILWGIIQRVRKR